MRIREKEEHNYKELYSYCLEDKYMIEDAECRNLYINAAIDGNVIDGIVYYILRYNRIDNENNVEPSKRIPIMLYINSPGGNVSDGYALIDAIITSKTPVYTVNLGLCASMGFLIFIAGKKRFAMPHSEFLMHDGSTMGYDSTAKMKDRMEFETIQLEKMTKEYILSNTKISDELYGEKYRCEWYFLPEEGKSIGVVDYIIGKDCTIDDVL